jgi:histidinol-phosphate aminotransferase
MQTTRRALLATATAFTAWGCASKATLLAATAPGRASSRSVVRLDANESPYGPGPAARAALRDAIGQAGRYTDLDDDLAAAIAARHGVTTDHVVLGTGSFAILEMAARFAQSERGPVIVPHPTFPCVADATKLLGGSVVRVPLDRNAAHDLDAMSSAITQDTRLVYVCNPNNPTGAIVPASDLAAFCTRHAARTLVMIDEAYADYVEDARYGSMDVLVRQGARVIVVRSFSKLFGLAGVRIGYALAPPAVVKRLRAARTGSDRVWISGLAASAAIASLTDGDFVKSVRRDNASVRAKFVADLGGLGLVVPESHANFVYFVPPGRPQAFREAVAQRHVAITARDEFGGCRVSIGFTSEMTAAAEAIASALPQVR